MTYSLMNQNFNMKKKILLLSDDLRFTSGIATVSKEIVLGTVHKYDWVQLGAAINHPDIGKIIDISENIRTITGVDDANVKIYPSNGYGNIFVIRELIKYEKPDAILHFTDPHYWEWLYEHEHEIRQKIPLLYYHVWDNIPSPIYNRNYYESCDWIGCISKLTYGVVKNVTKDGLLSDKQVSYVPHGINSNTFKPVTKISPEIKNLVEDKEFVILFNNRNIRRKQVIDIIYSFKLFCDNLEDSSKCLLLLHTAPIDENGTDLIKVINDLTPNYNIKFTNLKLEQDKLNELYNISDCTINISNNEGFGLATAESLMAGTPIIINVTGGLQDQCGFKYKEQDYVNIGSLHDKTKYLDEPHGKWCFPIWPSSITLNGSIPTPYIFEDRVNIYDVAKTMMLLHGINKKERKKIGLKGRDFALKNLSSSIMCDKLIEGIETTFDNYKPKQKFNLYKVI